MVNSILSLFLFLCFLFGAQLAANVPEASFVNRIRRHSNNGHGPLPLPAPLSDPALPQVPPALANLPQQCLFWQYIQAQPLGQTEVKQGIQELCSNNRTSTHDDQNGWCEIDVDLIISQMNDNNVNSMLRLDTDSIASVKHLQIFIHFTQNGLWQVLAIPDCPNAEDSAESAVAVNKRVVRSLFKF